MFMAKVPQTLSRSYASRAAVTVPLKLHGIDGRYATALFTAATKESCLPAVESELSTIRSIIAKDAPLRTFLETPLVDRVHKTEGVKSLLAKGKYSQVTKNFFGLLAENGRLDQTSKIISAFGQLMTAARGEVSVVVTSAKELDAKLLQKVKDTLQKSSIAEKGSKLLISNKVDPQILGGLVIEVGEKTIDLSVSSRITKLNQLLAEAVLKKGLYQRITHTIGIVF